MGLDGVMIMWLDVGTRVESVFEITHLIDASDDRSIFRAENITPDAPSWARELFVKQFSEGLAKHRSADELHLFLGSIAESFGSCGIALPGFAGLQNGSIILAYPFIKGRTLREFSRSGARTDQAFQVSAALFQTIAAAHEAGISHNCITSKNVMVSRNTRHLTKSMCLVDIESVSHEGRSILERPHQESRFTAPEQAGALDCAVAGAKADVYASALVVAEMLLGREEAFDRSSIADVIEGAAQRPLHSTAKRNELGRILQACLELDPRNRPDACDAAAVLGGLNADAHSWEAEREVEEPSRSAADRPKDTLKNAECYLELVCRSAGRFRRRYLSTHALSGSDLMGSGLKSKAGELVGLRYELGVWTLIGAGAPEEILCNSCRVGDGDAFSLNSGDTLIVSGVEYEINIVRY